MNTFSMIFSLFAESDSMRLDCTGTSGLGFGPLVFDLYLKAEGSDLCYLGTTFGHPCTTFGHPWCPFSDLVPTLGRGSGALGPLVGESLEKGTQNEGNGDPKWTHFR